MKAYIANAASAGMAGEWDVELSSARCAYREVFHVQSAEVVNNEFSEELETRNFRVQLSSSSQKHRF